MKDNKVPYGYETCKKYIDIYEMELFTYENLKLNIPKEKLKWYIKVCKWNIESNKKLLKQLEKERLEELLENKKRILEKFNKIQTELDELKEFGGNR